MQSAARTRTRTLYGVLVVVCLLRVAHLSAQRNAHADWSEGDDAQGFADVEAERAEEGADDDHNDDSGFARWIPAQTRSADPGPPATRTPTVTLLRARL